MNDDQSTVARFFKFPSSTGLSAEDYEQALQALPLDEIREAVNNSNPVLVTYITAESLIKSLTSLLDIPLWDVIEKAWTEGKLFEKYCDPENYSRNELITIILKEHEVLSEYRPSIEVLINGAEIGSIEFQLDLALTLSGAGLLVRGGDIEEIQAGQIQGSAKLACEGVHLFALETGRKDLPGTIRFSGKTKSQEGM